MKILVTEIKVIGTKLTEYFLKKYELSNIFGLNTGYFKKCITNDKF